MYEAYRNRRFTYSSFLGKSLLEMSFCVLVREIIKQPTHSSDFSQSKSSVRSNSQIRFSIASSNSSVAGDGLLAASKRTKKKKRGKARARKISRNEPCSNATEFDIFLGLIWILRFGVCWCVFGWMWIEMENVWGEELRQAASLYAPEIRSV